MPRFTFISRIRSWLGIEREFHAASVKEATCINRYGGKTSGLDSHFALVGAHFLSSGIVSFARGLNDTPEIAAVLILAPAFNAFTGLSVVGITIAVGAALCARRVAESLSKKITTMNHGQGFTSNLLTGMIVIFFSLSACRSQLPM